VRKRPSNKPPLRSYLRLNVEPAHLLHHQRQAGGIAGRGQQVQVVRHQDVGVDRHVIELGALLEPDQEALVVGLFAKDHLAVIAALDDVVRLLGNDESGLACHGVCSNVEQAILQQKSTLSPINRKRRQKYADSVPIYWTHKPGAIETAQC
jgi:hypothetical protein